MLDEYMVNGGIWKEAANVKVLH
ncbi:Protein of unknown function [Bacillus thuringiensis]|uniref:Uncharacterized protein n=2 Tax=Bacillus cereus group TaxID=86661 RepID=A0A1C4CKX5_BACTU|nr:Protein of unknown function [Bacillus thuringiensis]SCL92251.1 Protein of unknown function [Bacillus wiedmannii]